MDSFYGTSQSSQQSCGSIEELQHQLGQFLQLKRSPTRAEHASLKFELRSQTVFALTADAESGHPDGGDPAQVQHQQVTRTVTATESAMNQPSDDPALQQSVAKHIISKIGLMDGSSWTIRQVSRAAQGWTFTYICKDSVRAWNRANAKRADKPVIGAFSGPGGADPVNTARPAFDCRGTLTISFTRSSRSVLVKYDHTPLHETVSQLLERFAPPPPPAPPANSGNNKTPKAKRPPPAEGEEGSTRKKPKRSRKSAARAAPEAQMMDVDAPGEPVNELHTANGAASGSGVGSEAANVAATLNIPPAEAERRRQTAVNLLRGKGIDPDTLSPEQMNIFSNQAPGLQEASLEMLARYGAERLRIVHPDYQDQASSTSNNSTPAPNQSANQASSTNTAADTQSSETPTKKMRSQKKKKGAQADGSSELAIGDGAVVAIGQNGAVGTTTSALQPARARKTRGSCDTCKQRKVKCTKEHPACSNCQESGLQCVYSPPKPRRKSEKSAPVVDPEDSDGQPGLEEQEISHEAIAPLHPTTSDHTIMVHQGTIHAPMAPAPDLDNDEFIPDPDILSGPHEAPHTTAPQPPVTHHQPAQPNTTFPQLPIPEVTNTRNMAIPSLTFPPTAGGNQRQSGQGLTFPHTNQNDTPQASPTTGAHTRSRSGTRHSLPQAQTKQTPVPVPQPVISPPTSGWNAHNIQNKPAPAPTRSPNAVQQQAPKRPRSGRSAEVDLNRHTPDSMQAAATLTQAASQARQQTSPVANKSPYQTASRAKSRQGHRSQNSTPATHSALAQPPPQQSSSQAAASSPIPNYDSYGRYSTANSNTMATSNRNSNATPQVSHDTGSYNIPSTRSTAAAQSYPASSTSYDFSRNSSGSSNTLGQALKTNSGYGSSNTSANQWNSSQSRNSSVHTAISYSMPANTASSQSYNTRASQHSSSQASVYDQNNQTSYGSYSHPQPSQDQSHQTQQQQGWYGLPASNSTSQSSYGRSNDYGGISGSNNTFSDQRNSNISNYGNQGFGGSDEQSIYDLLRANGSH